ncbi:hypothetical protein BDZ97DRAFT_1709646 [Flammula alnicola]|nr:hypothetical protein BDZ97DRAFT_1709646 [Flammula alnicola]
MPRPIIMRVTLETLPVEIICHILGNLGMHDLLTCTMVTKHLRKVVVNSSRLQYTIELGRHRMISLLPASSSPSFATRLKFLHERETNWKYINWRDRQTLDLPPTGSVYEFVGGLYGNGREDESRVTASISFLELPSSNNSFLGETQEELKLWTHAMEDVNIIDFTMDPSQDLLVLVALAPPDSKYVYELHLRSITLNKPHQKAQISVLPCWKRTATNGQSSEFVSAVRVQVAGNLVALLIKEIQEGTGAHLEIWNWQNSPQYSCSMTRTSGIDDFTFLTPDIFLVVRPAGRFEVYTFVDPCQRSTTPVLRVTYSFPPLSPGYMYWYISMSSNPAPGYVPRHWNDSTQGAEIGNKKQTYYPRPDERMHACCLYIFNPAGEENAHVNSFVFFLNLQTLLNPPTEWIAKAQAQQSSMATPKKRSPESATNANSSANSSSSPVASSSSTSPVPIEIPIHGALSQSSSESTLRTDANPFIPPPFPISDGDRHLLSYPLFPTFDDHRPPTNPGPGVTVRGFHAPRMNLPKVKDWTPTSRPAPGRRVRPATSSITSIPPNTDIPWEVWGPQSTRWFEECLSTDWQHAIYGMRTVDSVTLKHRPIPMPASMLHLTPSVLPTFPTTNGAVANDASHVSVSAQTQINGSAAASSSSSQQTASQPAIAQTGIQSSQSSNSSGSGDAGQSEGTDSDGDEDADGDGGGGGDGNADGDGDGTPQPGRFLRVRDFNPYSFTEKAGALIPERTNSKDTFTLHWRQPRLVTDPTTTPVKGVFTKDIVSSLPYMEIVSREMFEVTDVMMDDCRLLLLKRGQSGKLKRVEVLTM